MANFQNNQISVILPSYNPDENVINVINDLMRQGFSDVIVVNDGSRAELKYIFEKISCLSGCSLVNHEINRGKGAALKTGMDYFLRNRPDGMGVLTIDDDGQHLVEDAQRCASVMAESGAMVLGSRDFNNNDVPPKSRFGNTVMSTLFKIGVGLKISDTQTGLRAIPRDYIGTFLSVKGNRFEYETNMLITAKKQGLDITEVPIKTVYIDSNKGTHFKAIKDSAVIMLQFVKYSLSSLLSCGIDLLGFYLILTLISVNYPPDHRLVIFLSTLIARFISVVFNFFFNKNIVFKHKGNRKKAALKYLALCAFSLVVSSQMVALIARAPAVNTALLVTLVKVFIDTALFIFNYFVQKRWVYKQ